MNDPIAILMVLFPAIFLVGGFALIGLTLHHRARLRMLVQQERLALIEKGMASELPARQPAEVTRSRAANHQAAGIILMGLGIGLLILIVFVGEVRVAVGLGGATVTLGLAFLASGALARRLDDRTGVRG